jgi:hypothetical protein
MILINLRLIVTNAYPLETRSYGKNKSSTLQIDGPGVDSDSDRNEYRESSWGEKAV